MGNINIFFKCSLLAAVIIFVSGCSSVYWGSIKNNTSEGIHVKLTFSNEYGTQILELQPIKSQENELWHYEQSSLVKTKIDKDLSQVEATNSNGCTITLNRDAIDKKVENHELEVVIEPQDFIDSCGK
ncbi:hypothetical protein [Pseudoalteromonas ruthenica]|uniref:hypothetical protein n=1 Tax=Pseudoalteromonas ruthenica TaxID=151081 RepID=UPI0005FA82E8|nr:hypothetical protein [Pseudoalteromonas ruthenica]TMO90127.1 hypothetical protein CWC12_01285 [Pseudoalteromonas ruthenica]TMO90782.1 hypothetical protein CWC13_18100 [Pseudoalteromonas ruthenica]TMP01019.1 hypothetical protein CWC07_01470 [Pseudoalteromonas ruthenica]TMP09751.1 hypothetical protein CWC08_10020 [Pseudoalteromonas ruthenica]TMP11620.1 hypothetical protein CWC09_03365 [Pseudoalteromonas ruthenica]